MNRELCPCCEGATESNMLTAEISPTGAPVFTIGCVECGMSTGGYPTEQEALEAWNRRPPKRLIN